ncbi:MAG: 1-deoxy-D-xylulose-5-phosphate reductoisomerase [Clostridia bacterium]|nr:1-deoxy-D-xylulose-5-phosphate reductoisomerase [Clostridia bacterium]
MAGCWTGWTACSSARRWCWPSASWPCPERRYPVKNVAILGSTGSIGRQALDVVKAHPDLFALYGVSAYSSEDAFLALVEEARPQVAVFSRPVPDTDVRWGEQALLDLAADPQVDVVVLAISGIAALKPLLSALRAGKRVAIANKESLVCGGDLVKKALQQGGGELLPVDSEQSAIFQCLQNGRRDEVEKLILTASGGPFFRKQREELRDITPADAVKHPTWSMGRKISLDSATLMNKGLEVIEAARLFDFSGEKIEVLIHPQSVVHSMVEYRDGTVMANLSTADMRLPIQYAMTWPERAPSPAKPLKLWAQSDLSFYKPDMDRFPALRMAYDCLKAGGGCPVVYNGANERAAELFFSGRLGFLDIEESVAYALDRFRNRPMHDLSDILAADGEARRLVDEFQVTRS